MAVLGPKKMRAKPVPCADVYPHVIIRVDWDMFSERQLKHASTYLGQLKNLPRIGSMLTPPIIYFLAILKDLGWPKKTCQTSFTIYAWPQSGFFISKNISRGGNICFQSIKYQYLCAWYSQTQDFLQVIICVMVKLIWNPSVDWNDPIYHILHREAGIL